jgi:hypothetical protein
VSTRHSPIEHRYINPGPVRDPVGKLLRDVTEQVGNIELTGIGVAGKAAYVEVQTVLPLCDQLPSASDALNRSRSRGPGRNSNILVSRQNCIEHSLIRRRDFVEGAAYRTDVDPWAVLL